MRVYFELMLMMIKRRIFMLVPNAMRVRMMRGDGMRIGEGCLLHTPQFGSEPYLIELGNRVAVSAGTLFVTHDASGWLFRKDHPHMCVFGEIKVGDDVYFGMNCTVLPGTTIGSNCVIGAGSVVRGEIPDNSVVMGNPAKVIMQTPLLERLMVNHRHRFDGPGLTWKQRREALWKHFGIR